MLTKKSVTTRQADRKCRLYIDPAAKGNTIVTNHACVNNLFISTNIYILKYLKNKTLSLGSMTFSANLPTTLPAGRYEATTTVFFISYSFAYSHLLGIFPYHLAKMTVTLKRRTHMLVLKWDLFVLLTEYFLLVRKDMDINEHERLFNITVRDKL